MKAVQVQWESAASIGSIDRFLRFALSIVLAQLGYFWLASPWNWLAYAAAVIMIATAAVRFCPIYSLFGIASAPAGKSASAVVSFLPRVASLWCLRLEAAPEVLSSRASSSPDFNALNRFYKLTPACFSPARASGPRQLRILTGSSRRCRFSPRSANLTKTPYDLKGDVKLEADFASVGRILTDV